MQYACLLIIVKKRKKARKLSNQPSGFGLGDGIGDQSRHRLSAPNLIDASHVRYVVSQDRQSTTLTQAHRGTP